MRKLIGIFVCMLLILTGVISISERTIAETHRTLGDTKVHILPCADVFISIREPENYDYKSIILDSTKTWGLFRNINVNNGKASLITTCCPSINVCYFGYGYENNESVSLRIPLFYGKLEYLKDYGPKILLMGYAILPILTVEL